VIVHIHDIFLPADYPKEWVPKRYKSYAEQYLIQVLLTHSIAYELLWASSYIGFNHPEKLEKAFPSWWDSHLKMPEANKIATPSLDERMVWPCRFWMKNGVK
jgi:hypothetical protein